MGVSLAGVGVEVAGVVTGGTNHVVAGEGSPPTTLPHAPPESRGWPAFADHDGVHVPWLNMHRRR